MLPRDQFMRVHRHAFVNLACVESHRRDSRETGELRVAGAREPVPVSRSFLAEVEARIEAGA
jgi:DNA-binding LytR/AlgR family response regulator